jgi:hypothetical protein
MGVKQRQIAHQINQRKRYVIRLSLYKIVHMQLIFSAGWSLHRRGEIHRDKKKTGSCSARVVAHEVSWRPHEGSCHLSLLPLCCRSEL